MGRILKIMQNSINKAFYYFGVFFVEINIIDLKKPADGVRLRTKIFLRKIFISILKMSILF